MCIRDSSLLVPPMTKQICIAFITGLINILAVLMLRFDLGLTISEHFVNWNCDHQCRQDTFVVPSLLQGKSPYEALARIFIAFEAMSGAGLEPKFSLSHWYTVERSCWFFHHRNLWKILSSGCTTLTHIISRWYSIYSSALHKLYMGFSEKLSPQSVARVGRTLWITLYWDIIIFTSVVTVNATR